MEPGCCAKADEIGLVRFPQNRIDSPQVKSYLLPISAELNRLLTRLHAPSDQPTTEVDQLLSLVVRDEVLQALAEDHVVVLRLPRLIQL